MEEKQKTEATASEPPRAYPFKVSDTPHRVVVSGRRVTVEVVNGTDAMGAPVWVKAMDQESDGYEAREWVAASVLAVTGALDGTGETP